MSHAQREAGGDKFYGKYRARVTNTYDGTPGHSSGRGRENRGRIKVECPAVYGAHESPWCEPLWGYALDGGGDFVMPELGDCVYIEFERGNPNLPIWSGAWVSRDGTPLASGAMYGREADGCGMHGAPTPHAKAKTLAESAGGADAAYAEHRDAARVIQFGKFWLVFHRKPPAGSAIGDDDWMRVYMECPGSPGQELFELFVCESKLWLKRKRGTMTFYSDDDETYLEHGAGRFRLVADGGKVHLQRDTAGEDYHIAPYGGAEAGGGGDFELLVTDGEARLRRKDSSLTMTDAETALRKGGNTVTMSCGDTVFDVPGNLTFNVGGDISVSAGGGISRAAGASISDRAPKISHN